jgi:hypothetical protein
MRFRLPGVGFYFCVVPAVLLAWRLVWEQTSLSWEHGPQMVGFSLAHSGLGIILFIALLAAVAWALVVIGLEAFTRGERNVTNTVGAAAVLIAAALVFIPYGRWVQVFAFKIAKGPHAAEFLVHMAALGEVPAVEALLKNGVPINSSNSSGLRAIEAAVNAKHEAMRELLSAQGGTDKRF